MITNEANPHKTDVILALGPPVVMAGLSKANPDDLRGAFVICDEGGGTPCEVQEAAMRLLDNAR